MTLVEDCSEHCPYCDGDYVALHLVNGFYMCWRCAADEIMEFGWQERDLNK